MHTENIRRIRRVGVLALPGLLQLHDILDTRHLETLVHPGPQVVRPEIDIIRIELERLHAVVLGRTGMRRRIILQQDRLLLPDGLRQRLDVRRIRLPVHIIPDIGRIIDGSQLALQPLLHRIRIVQPVDQPVHHIRLLVGKIDNLRQIHLRTLQRRQLVDRAAGAHLLHGETRLLERIEVAVDRPPGHLQLVHQLVDGIIHVAREQLHQAQHPRHFGLVHGRLDCFCTKIPN